MKNFSKNQIKEFFKICWAGIEKVINLTPQINQKSKINFLKDLSLILLSLPYYVTTGTVLLGQCILTEIQQELYIVFYSWNVAVSCYILFQPAVSTFFSGHQVMAQILFGLKWTTPVLLHQPRPTPGRGTTGK